MLHCLSLDPDLAIRTDIVRGRFPADEAPLLRTGLQTFGLEHHFEKLALRHMPIHVQVLPEKGAGQRGNPIMLYEVREIACHDDAGIDERALERQSYCGFRHGPALRAVAFHKDLYRYVILKVPERPTDIIG